MGVLSHDQKDQFWRDGVLTVPDTVTPQQLAAIRADFAVWVEESKKTQPQLWQGVGRAPTV